MTRLCRAPLTKKPAQPTGPEFSVAVLQDENGCVRRSGAVAIGRRALLASCAGLAMVSGAHAQAWSTRPIRCVVPDTPGGGGDTLARIIQHYWALPQPLLIENRPGAAGRIALENVWRSPPDGSTLLLGNAGTNGIAAAIRRGLPYDIETDFTPISLISTGPNVLCINPRALAAHDIRSLIALLRGAPGRYNYGTSGAGTSGHFSMELLKMVAGIQVEHIPYRGAGPMVQGATAGDAPLLMANLSSINAYLQQGDLMPVAVTSLQRSPDLPDVPTLHEAGFTGFDTIAWNGLFGPPGLPDEIIHTISAEIARIAGTSEAVDKIRSLGVEVVASDAGPLLQRVRSDVAKWRDLVARTGIVVD